MTLAQKEFADNFYSHRFKSLLTIMLLTIISESIIEAKSGSGIFEGGFSDLSHLMALYMPVIGIALGYDSIVKEISSNSLNTLLNHPVYRDNIILGKIMGGFVSLALVIILSVISSVGLILILTGTEVNWVIFNRILIFAAISFAYLSIFFALGILFSIICKAPSQSCVCCVVAWLIFVIACEPVFSLAASVATGQIMYSDDDSNAQELDSKLQYLSPRQYYYQAITGFGFSNTMEGKECQGIFDTSHTVEEWFGEYWTNLVVLVIAPLLLMFSSAIIFLRKDITR
jgi:ABC-2 type transport system permease protein